MSDLRQPYPPVATLPEGPVDIVGDVHGELDTLMALIEKLGYDREGRHTEGRRLVFVGDLCDRGPESPRVLGGPDAGQLAALRWPERTLVFEHRPALETFGFDRRPAPGLG